MKNTSERRRQQRHYLGSVVDFVFIRTELNRSIEDRADGHLLDLSVTGASMRTSAALEPGHVLFFPSFPDRPSHVLGLVLWTRTEANDILAGLDLLAGGGQSEGRDGTPCKA